jgi:hypothetical protein
LAAVETNARIVGNQVTDIAWGFIDKAGVLKIPDKYDFAAKFSEGLARVAIRMGVSEGYVDHDGKIVIAPQFTSASDFSDGLAVVWSDESEYIDRSGAAVLSGVSAQWPFSDGLAVLGLNDHRVYIDKRGQKIAPYDIGLWPDSTIRGRVFDPGHKPVAGLPVQMMAFSDESRLYPTTAVTDVDGLFAFTEVPKGEYLVGINLNGLNSKLPYEPRFYPSATKREVAKPVHVDGSVTVQGVDFQIGNRLPTRRILVSAIWPDGAPVINASVNCESPRSDDRRYGADWINRYTDSKGEATCEVLTDRDFEVLVDHLFWSRSSRPVQPISTRPRILVRAGDETVHVTIPVDRVNDISDTERPTDMSPFNQNPPE